MRLVFLIFVLLGQLAFADEPTVIQPAAPSAAVEGTEDTSDSLPAFRKTATAAEPAKKSTPIWLRVLGSLVVVLGMIGGAYLAFQKLPNAKKALGARKMIEVLGQYHLGPKRSLIVIRVAGETMLVGSTENNINLIKPLALLDEDLGGAQGFTGALRKQVNVEIQKQTEVRDLQKDAEEEFSMKGLKELVGQKLKSMKEL
ncbi:MAG: flagellar biosynthetic protein FliO [Oligoflexia bacterium]|nr:flagellar biosynthetic protein FliO [Oligoflexia bacterium]